MDRSTALAFALSFVLGCTRDSKPVESTERASSEPPIASLGPPPGFPQPAAGQPQAHAAMPAASSESSASFDGTVVETMDAGGYTYAKLDSGTDRVWVAGPETKLAVGMKIKGARGTPMTAFHSTTLNRTFDTIYFISAFPIDGSAPPNPHANGSASAAASTLKEAIEPAAGGHTIARVFAERSTLVNKTVVVRGKVVKVNNQILGHNWLHLQDGTGAPGTHDLTITTDATVELGAIVVVRGTLTTNRDFGAGYKYDVLVENAAITAEPRK